MEKMDHKLDLLMAAFTKDVHTRPTFPHEMRKPSGLHVLERVCCLL